MVRDCHSLQSCWVLWLWQHSLLLALLPQCFLLCTSPGWDHSAVGVSRHTWADVPCLGSLGCSPKALWDSLCPFLAGKAGLWVSKTQVFHLCLSDPFGPGNLIANHCEAGSEGLCCASQGLHTVDTLHGGLSTSLSPWKLRLLLICPGWILLGMLENSPGFHVLWKGKKTEKSMQLDSHSEISSSTSGAWTGKGTPLTPGHCSLPGDTLLLLGTPRTSTGVLMTPALGLFKHWGFQQMVCPYNVLMF